jgi:hypothetical protein
MICTLTKYYSRDQVKKNAMGAAHRTYGREERCSDVLAGNLTEIDRLEDPDLEERIKLK